MTGLFYHGWTFDYKNNFAGAFWARGNSWFTAGAAEFIELCGDGRDDAVSRYVASCLADQVKELAKHQGENGLFTTLLDSEESYPETSATANIAYGILKGVRLGLLDPSYEKVGRRAAAAVIAKIAEDGTVQGVSYGTGMGPEPRLLPPDPAAPDSLRPGPLLHDAERAALARSRCREGAPPASGGRRAHLFPSHPAPSGDPVALFLIILLRFFLDSFENLIISLVRTLI